MLLLSFSQFAEFELHFAIAFKQNLALFPVVLSKTNSIRNLSLVINLLSSQQPWYWSFLAYACCVFHSCYFSIELLYMTWEEELYNAV